MDRIFFLRIPICDPPPPPNQVKRNLKLPKLQKPTPSWTHSTTNIPSFIDDSLIFLIISHVIPHYLTSSSYHHQSSAESYKMEAAIEELSSSMSEGCHQWLPEHHHLLLPLMMEKMKMVVALWWMIMLVAQLVAHHLKKMQSLQNYRSMVVIHIVTPIWEAMTCKICLLCH